MKANFHYFSPIRKLLLNSCPKLINTFGKQTQKELAKLLKTYDQHDVINPLIELGESAL